MVIVISFESKNPRFSSFGSSNAETLSVNHWIVFKSPLSAFLIATDKIASLIVLEFCL